MTFKPGDMVVVTPDHPIVSRRGQVATVRSFVHPCPNPNDHPLSWPHGEPIHDLDLPPLPELAGLGLGRIVACPPRYLRPYRESWDKAVDVETWIGELAKGRVSELA
jgi:hypothetical protein